MLEVSLLGPTEARLSGRTVSLTPLERNVLAILALSGNAVVSTERMIELLWGDRHPAAPSGPTGSCGGSRRRGWFRAPRIAYVCGRHVEVALDLTGQPGREHQPHLPVAGMPA